MKYANDIGGIAGQILIAAAEALDADYSKGDAAYSVTELIDDPHIKRLQREHMAEVVEPVSHSSFKVDGQIVHKILELAAHRLGDAVVIPEKRLFAEIEVQDGLTVRVSGQYDTCAITGEATLGDWKNTSVWAAMQDDPKPEWVRQLNLLGYLAALNGVHVEALEINLRLRDWSATQVGKKAGYPRVPYATVQIPMWPMAETRSYLATRIRAHLDAYGSTDCEPDGRWENPPTFAVMTAGLKRAAKVELSYDDALAWNDRNPDAKRRHRSIVERPGTNNRCEPNGDGHSYCPVTQWCARGRAAHGLPEIVKPTESAR